ncbi:hypothetical protein P2G88_02500 [Aliiglaciecola sp. CAU 1673]|uniref:hypothetical protein n=1 Tax=Aliiglaciecola sp. CAU 1673 TaxID=3032595 RepID=UPI0023DCBA66|nr:hypothetical protein [Aliiglaciecola sp. CAU 1673]MDF2177113.1 hypothetical protein [Aliiglaciecola sp. CAU 1673]
MFPHRLLPFCVAIALSGCELVSGNTWLDQNGNVRLISSFEQTSDNWSAGFSDYDAGSADTYDLAFGVKTLPDESGHKGFMLSGNNRSDDLFMFIKRQLTGLRANSRYLAELEVKFLSNAGEGCMGIGGAPGESVFVKFGFGTVEPKQQGYYLNLDIGSQAQGGNNAIVLGNVAAKDSDCSGTTFAPKTITTTAQHRLELTTDSQGSVWLFVGTDSGYEGLTTLYYDHIALKLIPK